MKTAKPKKPAIDPKDEMRLEPSDWVGVSPERMEAEIAQSSVFLNAQTARTFIRGTFGRIDFTGSIEVLRDKVAAVQSGNLSFAETILVAQATALDSIFTELARRAALNMGEYIDAAETYMRLALKAQSQCRTTLETLAEIKNPRPVAFVKQANIAAGPQQVNNGAVSVPPARAGESSIPSNELSCETHELLPDPGASAPACRIDTQVETLAEINRAAD